ncbi:MAG TPA: hypothetical protein H9684_01985 [Firmicutes bacterium]|nr:hypothetical protein [Bacillota bacterium]
MMKAFPPANSKWLSAIVSLNFSFKIESSTARPLSGRKALWLSYGFGFVGFVISYLLPVADGFTAAAP